jgi:hypothetical protein
MRIPYRAFLRSGSGARQFRRPGDAPRTSESIMNLPESAESPLAVAPAPPRTNKQIKASSIANEQAAQKRWKLMLADAKATWAKVPPEDLTRVNGNLHILAGLVQLRYHVSREEADQQAKQFYDAHPAVA